MPACLETLASPLVRCHLDVLSHRMLQDIGSTYRPRNPFLINEEARLPGSHNLGQEVNHFFTKYHYTGPIKVKCSEGKTRGLD
jgi:hypothetical protein